MEKNSLAWEIICQSHKANKRMFIIILVILSMWFATIGYLVYVLNDIGTIETTTTVEQSDAENNNYIGNNGDIINGTKDK
jgi:hypothetical protein